MVEGRQRQAGRNVAPKHPASRRDERYRFDFPDGLGKPDNLGESVVDRVKPEPGRTIRSERSIGHSATGIPEMTGRPKPPGRPVPSDP
jgi:hypothetical protein